MALADYRLATRAAFALPLANARYWPSVAPLVRDELRRWSQHAAEIPDPSLRGLAMHKLRSEHFNAEVAATLATLAPTAHRAHAVEAIVALEVMYDYLDGLTERPSVDPIRVGTCAFEAFTNALDPDTPHQQRSENLHPHSDDGGYLSELSDAVGTAFSRLPSAAATAGAARQSARRCAESQVRVHAAPLTGVEQLEKWAKVAASESGLGWREYLAGAVASVLATHALIAVAAEESATTEQAVAIDAAYLSISALSTMLDSLIDYERDLRDGEPWYMGHYDDRGLLAERLVDVARHAVGQVHGLPHSGHHLMTLVGVVAYYTSAPEANSVEARPLIARLHSELRPLITPTLAVMRTWRLAKRLRIRQTDTSPTNNVLTT